MHVRTERIRISSLLFFFFVIISHRPLLVNTNRLKKMKKMMGKVEVEGTTCWKQAGIFVCTYFYRTKKPGIFYVNTLCNSEMWHIYYCYTRAHNLPERLYNYVGITKSLGEEVIQRNVWLLCVHKKESSRQMKKKKQIKQSTIIISIKGIKVVCLVDKDKR